MRPAFAGAAAAAVALRLAFVLAFPGNYDTESYREVLGILDRGGEVYLETARYNYSPLWWNGLRAARGIGGALGLPLQAGVGLLLTAVDLATALVLYRLASRQGGRSRGEAAALLFLWNPVSVFATGWHGQFDNVGVLCLLLVLPGIGQQYFVWPIALGALFPGAGYFVYTVVSALFFIGSSRGFAAASPLLPGWYGPWWAALLWLGLEVRALSRQRPQP